MKRLIARSADAACRDAARQFTGSRDRSVRVGFTAAPGSAPFENLRVLDSRGTHDRARCSTDWMTADDASAAVPRGDVLVDVKKVVRVIGRLHCCEPRVVGAIVRSRPVVVVAGHEVNVAALAAG